MRNSVFLTVLFIAVNAWAFTDGPCGQIYNVITPENCPEIPEEAFQENHYGVQIPESSEEQLRETDALNNPIPYAPLWGPDILVTNECILTPRYDIGFDYDVNGHLYVALTTSNTTNDSIKIYRSTDRGYTWVNIYTLWFNISNPVCFFDFDFRVSKNDATPDMFFAWIDSSYTTNTRRFWFGKVPVDGSTPTWNQFDGSVAQTSNLEALAMDINEEADPYVIITYANNNIQWRTTQSLDQGANWTFYYHSSVADPLSPTCSFSDQTNFHTAIVRQENNNAIYFRNGTTAGGYSNMYISSTADPTSRTHLYVSADKTASNPNNRIVAVWRYNTGINSRIYQNISTDAGSNWQGEQIHTLVGDVYSSNPFVRFGQNGFALFTALDYQFTNDSLFACYYRTSDDTWGGKVYPNDHQPSGLLPSVGSYVSAGGNAGRVLVYRQYAANPIWFDRWNYTNSVEEQPGVNPSDFTVSLIRNNTSVTVSFAVISDSKVSIDIYDALGRKVTSLADGVYSSGNHAIDWNLRDLYGQSIGSGRYFVNFLIDDFSGTKTVDIF
ncbi:hypothetical protein JW890_02490 [candidate division WOR-3 bacterium]|nr:hypothetical protein [candidate division WOR-3 bacterium]